MHRTEIAALVATMALCASVVTVQAARRPPRLPNASRPKTAKAAPKVVVTLQVGDVVSVNGQLYVVSTGLLLSASSTPVPPTPVTLTGYNPNPVIGGNPVTMQGSNFTDPSTSATWNGAPLPIRILNPTTLSATMPAVGSATTSSVVLRSSGQTVTGPLLTVTPAIGPAPDMAVYGYRNGKRDWSNTFAPGQTIFIQGTGFGAAAGSIAINHKACTVVGWGNTEIETVCPALDTGQQPGPATLDIIRPDHLGWNSSQAFVIVAAPGRFGNR